MGVSAVVYDCYYSTWEVVGRMKRDLKARMNYQKKKKKVLEPAIRDVSQDDLAP